MFYSQFWDVKKLFNAISVLLSIKIWRLWLLWKKNNNNLNAHQSEINGMHKWSFLPLWNGQMQQGWSHVLLWPNTQQLEAPEPGLWSCTTKTKGHLHQETKPGCTKYFVLQTLIKHSKEKLKIPNTTNQEISKGQVKWSYWFYGWQITEELSHLNKGLFIKVLFNGFKKILYHSLWEQSQLQTVISYWP